MGKGGEEDGWRSERREKREERRREKDKEKRKGRWKEEERRRKVHDAHILVLFDKRTAFIVFFRRDSRELLDSASSPPPWKSS